MKTSTHSLSTYSLIELIVIHQQLLRLNHLLEKFESEHQELDPMILELRELLEIKIDIFNSVILSHHYWKP